MAYDQAAADAIRQLELCKQSLGIEVLLRREAHAQLAELREAFRAVDQHDWDYLYQCLGDGGRGRFWKAVFDEFRGIKQ